MGKVDENEGSGGLAPGTLIDGRYKVVRFIGQGGNGAVHEVEHVLTGRRLALKSLHDDTAYGRLEQEARATSLMKNGHAVKITDMGTNAGSSPYIVMELLEGQSLRTLLDDTGQLPLELTVNIALQVTECLAEAHQHGIVHRDLKPDNVYLCQGSSAGQYDVKVLDFGVVKIANDGPIPNSSLTRTGSTVGTPFYMSLEQLRNSSAVDQRADIYAMGVVLYEALSGRKPFQAETIGDLVYALCSGPPTHLSRLRPDLPTQVCDVIMRALSSNREQRQSSMIELAKDLLPFGDAALGVWLRTGDARRRGDSGAVARPGPSPAAAKGSLTPSGVKRGLPGTEAGPSRKAAPAIPRPDPRRPQPAEASPPDRSEDRDTPTEMYVKGVHSAVSPAGGSTVEPMPATAHTPAPLQRPDIDSRSGDRDTPTRAMEVVAAPKPAEGAPKVENASGDFMMTQPVRGPGEARQSFPSNPFGVPHLGSVEAGPHSAVVTGQVVFPGLRPAWQEKLDRALNRVGGFIERIVRSAAHRFRAASPRAQIVIVVAAASLFAAIVVLTIWLLTG